jgi:L-threonylcarbamoyladenylate synthase
MSHYITLSVEEVFSDVGWKALSETLLKGGLVIMPSDTTYACVVDASQPAAVEKLIAFKARPSGKAISVFVSSLKEAEKYVDISDDQRITLSALLPGPYTVILQSKHRVSKLLEAENGTLGIRVPHYDFLHKVTKKYGLPLTATSANLAGKSPHYSVEALLNSLSETKKDMIDVIVDAGPLPHNKPSTVIDISGGSMKVVRMGDMLADEILTSHSPEETQKIAQDIFERYADVLAEQPLVILLYGDLGSGKTEFTKGLGALLKTETIVSPTYVIYYEYTCDHPKAEYLYHFDLYRLRDTEECEHLGIEELLKPKNVLCIEWSEKSESLMPLLQEKAHVVKVHLKDGPDSGRLLSIQHAQL